MQDDPVNIDKQWKGDSLLEARHFMDLGVDGAFTDFPATWHKAVMQYEVITPFLASEDAGQVQVCIHLQLAFVPYF